MPCAFLALGYSAITFPSGLFVRISGLKSGRPIFKTFRLDYFFSGGLSMPVPVSVREEMAARARMLERGEFYQTLDNFFSLKGEKRTALKAFLAS